MLRPALTFGLPATVVACGLLAPLDGLTGGDAGVPFTPSDAAGDTTAAPDGAPPHDGAIPTDAADAADAPVSLPCEAGLTPCAAACVDLQSAPSSCGRCGHDCGGGACMSAVCQPLILAQGQDVPRGIAVSGANVYFTTHTASGYVASCPTTGCGNKPTVLTQGLAEGSGIALSGTSLFFMAFGNYLDGGGYVGNGAFSCTTTGCSPATALTSSPGNPVGTTTDGAFVYWNDSSLGDIFSCAVGGCGGTPTVLASGQSSPWYGIAVDAGSTFVYWVDRGAGTVARCDLPTCAGGVQPVATNLLGPFDLTLAGASVYFTDYDPNNPTNAGTVDVCPVTGCSNGNTAFATQQTTPSGIAADDAGIYWANNGDGTIAYCPKAGCPSSGPTLLAANQGGPFKVALDVDFVYWTDTTGGDVMKVAKP